MSLSRRMDRGLSILEHDIEHLARSATPRRRRVAVAIGLLVIAAAAALPAFLEVR